MVVNDSGFDAFRAKSAASEQAANLLAPEHHELFYDVGRCPLRTRDYATFCANGMVTRILIGQIPSSLHTSDHPIKR
jgi:hypothetical protein